MTIKQSKQSREGKHIIMKQSGEVKPWSQDSLIAAGAYPGFCNMKRLKVFLLSLEGMLVHRRSLPRNLLRVPTIRQYPFILLGGERYCESKVSCPRTPHNVSGQGLEPRPPGSGVERTNHEATLPPNNETNLARNYKILPFEFKYCKRHERKILEEIFVSLENNSTIGGLKLG